MENENLVNLKDKTTLNVNRLASIKKQINDLNVEKDELEGYFLKLAEEDLKNTKLKSVSYPGDGANKVIATIAESLKVVYPSYLKNIFGEAYKDAVTEDVKYKISASATRMLAGLYLNNFTKITVAEVIKQIAPDSNTEKVLLKKIKGANFATDKKNLMSIAGFDEKTAEEYAYFVSEAAVWENFMRLQKSKNCSEADEKQCLDWINGAIVVEETPKIIIEAS